MRATFTAFMSLAAARVRTVSGGGAYPALSVQIERVEGLNVDDGMSSHMRVLSQLRPAVTHGVMEWAYGASPIHAVAEAAAIGYFIGQSKPAAEAIRTVEAMEQAGAFPYMYGQPAATPAYERYEYYHRGAYGAPLRVPARPYQALPAQNPSSTET